MRKRNKIVGHEKSFMVIEIVKPYSCVIRFDVGVSDTFLGRRPADRIRTSKKSAIANAQGKAALKTPITARRTDEEHGSLTECCVIRPTGLSGALEVRDYAACDPS